MKLTVCEGKEGKGREGFVREGRKEGNGKKLGVCERLYAKGKREVEGEKKK